MSEWDPILKILGALAAPGGLWFWFDKYRNRIQIKVRQVGLTRGDASGRHLSLVLENIGQTATSAGPKMMIAGCSVKGGHFILNYRMLNDHVKLTPLDAVEVQAVHNDPENRTIHWAWYFVIKLPLSRGRTLRIRCRNVEFEQLGFFKFHWERMKFIYSKRNASAA